MLYTNNLLSCRNVIKERGVANDSHRFHHHHQEHASRMARTWRRGSVPPQCTVTSKIWNIIEINVELLQITMYVDIQVCRRLPVVCAWYAGHKTGGLSAFMMWSRQLYPRVAASRRAKICCGWNPLNVVHRTFTEEKSCQTNIKRRKNVFPHYTGWIVDRVLTYLTTDVIKEARVHTPIPQLKSRSLEKAQKRRTFSHLLAWVLT